MILRHHILTLSKKDFEIDSIKKKFQIFGFMPRKNSLFPMYVLFLFLHNNFLHVMQKMHFLLFLNIIMRRRTVGKMNK